MLLGGSRDEMRQINPGEKWEAPGGLFCIDKNDGESENEWA